MKKDRNAFFQNQSASSYFYPSNQMNTAPMYSGYGAYPMATESNSNFYQGPILAPQSDVNTYNNELESRLSKIERQLNRLDSRVTKLESDITPTNTDYTTNNMYMV